MDQLCACVLVSENSIERAFLCRFSTFSTVKHLFLHLFASFFLTLFSAFSCFLFFRVSDLRKSGVGPSRTVPGHVSQAVSAGLSGEPERHCVPLHLYSSLSFFILFNLFFIFIFILFDCYLTVTFLFFECYFPVISLSFPCHFPFPVISLPFPCHSVVLPSCRP